MPNHQGISFFFSPSLQIVEFEYQDDGEDRVIKRQINPVTWDSVAYLDNRVHKALRIIKTPDNERRLELTYTLELFCFKFFQS